MRNPELMRLAWPAGDTGSNRTDRREVLLSGPEILRALRSGHQPPRLQALQPPRWNVTFDQ